MKKRIFTLVSIVILLNCAVLTVKAQVWPSVSITPDGGPYPARLSQIIGKNWPGGVVDSVAYAIDTTAISVAHGGYPNGYILFEDCEYNYWMMTTGPVPKDSVAYLGFFDSYGSDIVNYTTLREKILVTGEQTIFEIPWRATDLPDHLIGQLCDLSPYWNRPANGLGVLAADLVFYRQPTYDFQYIPETIKQKGKLHLDIKGGSGNAVFSLDGGKTWKNQSDKIHEYEIANLKENGVVYIKDPNNCRYDAISLSKGDGGTGIHRPVSVPQIAHADVDKMGVYYVNSMGNFSFNITPKGENAGKVPVITTDRTSLPDSEGVQISDNGDGSFTVTILYIQQAINLTVGFATDNELISDGNKVWANNGRLYIETDATATACVYNTVGALVNTVPVIAGETANLSLPTGFYVVTINGKSYKVVLK